MSAESFHLTPTPAPLTRAWFMYCAGCNAYDTTPHANQADATASARARGWHIAPRHAHEDRCPTCQTTNPYGDIDTTPKETK